MRLALVVSAALLVICTIGWAQEEPSVAEMLTILESPKWGDREMTLKRFEFLIPIFDDLCPDATTEITGADMLYKVYTLITDAGLDEGLLELFNSMYEVTVEIEIMARLASESPPECAEIWALYALARHRGLSKEDAKVGLTAFMRALYLPSD